MSEDELGMWIGFGIDPLSTTVYMIACCQTEKECRALLKDPNRQKEYSEDVVYKEAFNFLKKDAPEKMYNWMRASGIIHVEAINIMGMMVKRMKEMLEEHDANQTDSEELSEVEEGNDPSK